MPKNLDSFIEWSENKKNWPWVKKQVIILKGEFGRKEQAWLKHQTKTIRAYLNANPEKHYSNWRRMVGGWLIRSHNQAAMSEEELFRVKGELAKAEAEIRRLKYGKKDNEPTAIGDIIEKLER